MQRHRRQYTRELMGMEIEVLRKAKIGQAHPLWTIRLRLDEYGLIKMTRAGDYLTNAGREALKTGKVTVRR